MRYRLLEDDDKDDCAWTFQSAFYGKRHLHMLSYLPMLLPVAAIPVARALLEENHLLMASVWVRMNGVLEDK